MKNTFSRILKWTFVLLLVAGLGIGVSLHFASATPPAAPQAAAKPPVPVTVKTLSEQKTRLWTEFSGRLHAVDSAEIRPEVSGRITEVRFQDGQSVKAGDILFVIDPRPFQAAVLRAEANLTTTASKVELAKLDLDRATTLIQTHAIAQSDLDRFSDAQRVAGSAQEAAQADLDQAKLDLEHAYVAAPISGRVSRAEITVGNLVQTGSNAPLLTTIVSNDSIYADFEVDEQTYMQTIRSLARGNTQEQLIPVQVAVQGDKGHVYNGFMQNFDNSIDVTSGTIRARAKFDNKDGALVPGMFVSVRLAGSQDRDALLIPERAIGFDQSKKFVYVVDDTNKVSYREVELGPPVGSQRLVVKGLEPGDKIVVDGTQHVKPDDTVTATELAPDDGLAASGAGVAPKL